MNLICEPQAGLNFKLSEMQSIYAFAGIASGNQHAAIL